MVGKLSLLLAFGLLGPLGPEPSKLDEIVARWKQTESRIHEMRVVAHAAIRQRTGLDANAPEIRRELDIEFAVDREGRVRSQSVGGTPGRIGTTEVLQQKIVGAYDGKVVRVLRGKDEFDWGYIGPDKSRIPREVDPRNYLHEHANVPLSETFDSGRYQVIGAQQVGERHLVLLESMPVLRDGASYKGRFLLDPALDFAAVVRSSWIRFADQDWREYSRTETSDFRRSGAEIWVPGKARYTSYHVDRKQADPKQPPDIAWQFEITFRDWQFSPTFKDGEFSLEFPPGVFVQDDR